MFQAKSLEQISQELDVKIDAVVNIDVDFEQLEERLIWTKNL